MPKKTKRKTPRRTSHKVNWSQLTIAILFCQAAGIFGTVFSTPTIPAWYMTLAKPAFTPPNWVFGPVWLLLYTLMGISLYLIWQHPGNGRDKAHGLMFFYIQLVLNAAWGMLFFGFRSPLIAFVDVVLLWVTVVVTMTYFRKVSTTAAGLLLPYIVWVSFAVILNFVIVVLNTSALF